MECDLKKHANYYDILESFPKIWKFLSNKKIKNLEKLDSLWRKENLLLRIKCWDGDYVFKKINGKEKQTEQERIKIMKKEYPSLMPEIYVCEGDAYLIEYINGDSFFNLKESERISKINSAGRMLNNVYYLKKYPKGDISEAVKKSFDRYREKRKEFFFNNELKLNEDNFKIFRNVSLQPSHNDLNAANLLYGEKIKLIDPSEEGFNDIARDIGRYCASCFFNNYDYFGNNKKFSLEIAESFLSHFNEELLGRAKYYIGESFLSFLAFDTVSDIKYKLKKLSINLLLKNGKIINLLEESL